MKCLHYKNALARRYYHQWPPVVGAALLLMEMGIYMAWSSPYLARLTAPNSPLPLNQSEASWVASLYDLGRFIGVIIGTIYVNYLGTRRTLLYSIFPFCGCWFCIICATNPIWLYIARLSGGLSIGVMLTSMPFYNAEISYPEIRGANAVVAIGGSCIGYLLSSILGSKMSMQQTAAIYIVPCILMILLFMWLPDTPLWLVKIHDYEAAKKSIMWYLPLHDPEIELIAVKKLAHFSTFKQKLDKCIKSGPIRRAIFLIFIIYAFAHLSGACSIGFYMETIIIRSKLTLINPSILVILLSASTIVVTIASMAVIDKYGRKFLLSISGLGMTIAQIGLGINSYLVQQNADLSNLQWLPIVSLLIFISFYSIGVLTVPSTVLGEIFPSDVNNIVSCAANLIGAVCSFVVVKSFLFVVDSIGEYYVFWIQAAVAFLSVLYTYFFLPETKAKSLQQIQDELMT